MMIVITRDSYQKHRNLFGSTVCCDVWNRMEPNKNSKDLTLVGNQQSMKVNEICRDYTVGVTITHGKNGIQSHQAQLEPPQLQWQFWLTLIIVIIKG